MKARQNGKLSVHQKACIASFKRHGYACVVAYGWEEAWAEIVKYLTSAGVLIKYAATGKVVPGQSATHLPAFEA